MVLRWPFGVDLSFRIAASSAAFPLISTKDWNMFTHRFMGEKSGLVWVHPALPMISLFALFGLDLNKSCPNLLLFYTLDTLLGITAVLITIFQYFSKYSLK